MPAEEWGGEFRQEFGQPGQLHVRLAHDALLTQGDDLLAGGQDVPLLVDGDHIFLDEVHIALPHLDEVGGDGVAGKGAVSHLDVHLFALVGLEFRQLHNDTLFMSCFL